MSEEDIVADASTTLITFIIAITMVKAIAIAIEILAKLAPVAPQPPQQPARVAPSGATIITSDNYTTPSPLELPPNPPTVHESTATLKVVVAPSTGASAHVL